MTLNPSLFFTQNFKQGTPNTDEVQSIFDYLKDNYDFKNILEIGFLKGHSATWFLETFPNCRVTSVDNVLRGNEDALFHHLFRLKYGQKRFKFHYGDSSIITDFYEPGTFDFAFIDGDHTFEGCLKDIDMCLHLQIPVLLLDNVESNGYCPITKEKKDGVSKAIAARSDQLKLIKKFIYYTHRADAPDRPAERIMELYYVRTNNIQEQV